MMMMMLTKATMMTIIIMMMMMMMMMMMQVGPGDDYVLDEVGRKMSRMVMLLRMKY